MQPAEHGGGRFPCFAGCWNDRASDGLSETRQQAHLGETSGQNARRSPECRTKIEVLAQRDAAVRQVEQLERGTQFHSSDMEAAFDTDIDLIPAIEVFDAR